MALPAWSPDDLDRVVAGNETVLVDLHAAWCPQCGPQQRVLERLAPELAGRVELGSVDVGEHVVVADRYQVQTLPAILIFRDGDLVERLVGFTSAPLVRITIAGVLAAS
jgi:thioredoxin 1